MEKGKSGTYSKQQLIDSKRFRDRRDALQACLLEDKAYTIKQAEDILAGFLKSKVR